MVATKAKVDALMVAEDDQYRLRILKDEDSLNPLIDYDMLGKMICWHRWYKLGHDHKFDDPREFFESIAEEAGVSYEKYENWPMEKLKAFVEDRIVYLHIWGYDHGGITIRATEEGNPFHCPWDSGWLGFIYVTKEKIRQEYGVKRVTKKIREQVLEVLRSEVEVYDQYLRGDVYGFVLEHKIPKSCISGCLERGQECTCWPEDDRFIYREIDSCWGFYGDDPKENGIAERLAPEAVPLLDKLEWVV